jgi:hypothetical protein
MTSIKISNCEQENFSIMFSSITWGQYLSAIIVLIIIYYAVIGFKFYRWEILNVFGIRKVEDGTISTASLSDLRNFITPKNPEDRWPKPALEIDISPLVKSFTDEVKAFVQGNENTEIRKDEIINSLNIIFSKYPALKNADCRNDLEQFVLYELNVQYPHLLHLKDISRLWK